MTQPDVSTRDGGGLTSKVGPLPVWGWVALAAAGGIAVLLWLQNRRTAAAAAGAGTNATTQVQGADAAQVANIQNQLSTVLSQIRDVQAMPLTPGPAGPAGATGGIGPPGTPASPAPAPTNGWLHPGTTYVVTSKDNATHDSPGTIARFFGRTRQEIVDANPGQTYNPGNRINIPPVYRNT